MSLLFSFENCSLISHKDFLNEIYNDVVTSDGERCVYEINSNLFELNVPYRFKSSDEIRTKKRQRKIINKTKDLVAKEHQHEYDVVNKFLFCERKKIDSKNSNQ